MLNYKVFTHILYFANFHAQPLYTAFSHFGVFILYLENKNSMNCYHVIYVSLFVLDVEIFILEKYPLCDF